MRGIHTSAYAISIYIYSFSTFSFLESFCILSGTGKTTTLVALLNALHIRQMNKYYDTVKKIVNVNNAKSTGAKRVALEEAKKGMPRLLVCAPSNNAIDNVIRKIMIDGFIDGHGNKYNPPIVRIGSGQSDTVKEVSLETKLQSLMNEANDLPKIQSIIAGFKSELNRIQSGIGQLKRRQLAIAHASIWPLSEGWEIRCDESFDETNRVYFVNHKEKSTTFECPPPPEPGEKHVPATSMPEYRTATQQLVKLVHKFTSIKGKLDRYSLLQKVSNISGASGKGQKSFDAVKQQLETDILDSTHIVLTTLGTSGCRALEAAAKFEVVVVDEAAQSVEPATLVALQLGSSHAILVGDPQQLPATIFSVSGRNTKYDRSLFQRLEEAGHAVHLLDTQYRMHPEISEFPRKIFYGGYLKDGPNVKSAEYGGVLRMVLKSKIPSLRVSKLDEINLILIDE
jgi:senataxin